MRGNTAIIAAHKRHMERAASLWPVYQRGQALILAVVCLLALVGGLFVVFDTGQAVTKKEQLVNASDAAAYSVGIEEARALNTAAYFNRAEVANQIAIAQLVSMQSYGNYADSLLVRGGRLIEAIGSLIPPLIPIGQGMVLVQRTVVKTGLMATGKFFSSLVTILNGLNAIYAGAQQYVFLGFSAQSFFATANDVVKANTHDLDGKPSHAEIAPMGQFLLFAQLKAFAGGLGASRIPPQFRDAVNTAGYTHRYTIPQPTSPDPFGRVHRTWAGDRVARVMMRARDGFSADRSADFDPFKILGVGWIEHLLPVSFSLPKKGSTDLVDYDRWVGVDSLNLKIRVGWCGFLSIGFCYKKKAPLAFGAAAALHRETRYNRRKVINPGISLTQGYGDSPSTYQPGHGNGYYSPYRDHTYAPYMGALNNNIGKWEIVDDPSDELFTTATPREVSWLPIYIPPMPRVLHQFLDPHVGLQDYSDVEPTKALEPYRTSPGDESDVGPIFTVYVRQPDKTVRTGANIGMEGGRLKAMSKGVGGYMTAISSAQVYYDRPRNLPFVRRHAAHHGDQRELGNLFEPYWQVRLVPTPTSYKVALRMATVAHF